MSKGFHRLPSSTPWSNSASPMIEKLVFYGGTEELIETNAVRIVPDPTFEPGPGNMTREMARQSGYTGDTCDTCGSTRVKVSGHCTVCEACGTTSGCS